MHISTIFFSTLFLLATHCEATRVSRSRISSESTTAKTSTAKTSTGKTSTTVTASQAKAIKSKTTTAVTASQTAASLNASVADCFLTLPDNFLTAAGLATPFLLNAPCSQSVVSQQAFAEAAVLDPTTGAISIYHPLVIDANTKPAVAPVVPTLPTGAVVGLWFGFNGGTLELLDTKGEDANASPTLKAGNCTNGLPGVNGDVFGQVSWCNAEQWFTAANSAISSGKTVIPDLGVDKLGNACPTSRSFEITDACPSDNVPTQYLLLPNGETAQDTAANRKSNPGATVINNASDEALLTNIIDPIIGCTPFTAPSLDDPGSNVPALALSELQAAAKQAAPIGLVPLNDPDTLLTSNGDVSTDKTNVYRLGVNQPVISSAANGDLVPYCQDMVSVAPAFFKGFQTEFTQNTSPDTDVGNNLFTFMANRYLQSLTQLTCPSSAIPFQPVVCKLDGNGAATSCDITLKSETSTSTDTNLLSTTTTSKNDKLLSTTSTSTSTLATSSKSSTNTKTHTKTIVVEVVTFFVFLSALGSPPPGVTSNSGIEGFIVEEETFKDLPGAAAAACTKQFNACAALAGSAFSGTDCLDQMNSCQGVATSATTTAATPATLSPTVTIPASGTGTVSVAGVVQQMASASASASTDACAPVTVTVTPTSAKTVTPRGHRHI